MKNLTKRIHRERVATPDSECDACKRIWKCQMRDKGRIYHFCERHASHLLAIRDGKKNVNEAALNQLLGED